MTRTLEDMQVLYHKWLRAAYLYYITPGEDTGMHDLTWDAISRELYAARHLLPKETFPVLHHEYFSGGSLFWLGPEGYPSSVCKDHLTPHLQ